MTSYGGIIRIRSSFVADEYSRVEVRLLPLSLQTQAPLYLFILLLYTRFYKIQGVTGKYQKCSSAGKTGFGENGRQTKSSPERGGSGASWGLLLILIRYIGTRICSKIVVKCEKIVFFRGFRGYFGANSGSAMADEQYLFHCRVPP